MTGHACAIMFDQAVVPRFIKPALCNHVCPFRDKVCTNIQYTNLELSWLPCATATAKVHPLQLLGDKHSACCLNAVPNQLHCVVPRPSETKCANQMEIRNLSHSSTRIDLPKYLARLEGMANEKNRKNVRIPKNSTNSARVALAFSLGQKKQCFQVDFKKHFHGHFPCQTIASRHLFQGSLCDLRCSLAVPGNQGIRHRRGDRTKDPYIQGLKTHHVHCDKMGENLG